MSSARDKARKVVRRSRSRGREAVFEESIIRTELLPADRPARWASAVERAVELLRKGQVVALPTETVYGLAADARSAAAVRAVFRAKGRPAHNPVIVHVESAEMARDCVSEWPPMAESLARAFWPGPLTLVLPRSKWIPDEVTAGGETVAVRCPRHPLFLEVIRGCGFPLAAPSANRSSEVSPTSAEHVLKALGGRIPCVVDGGECSVGIESTVLDLTISPPQVLRPGMIHEESIEAVIGRLGAGPRVAGGALRSPGLLARHYAPRARLVVLAWVGERDLERNLGKLGVEPARTCVLAHDRIPRQLNFLRVAVIPRDPEAYARALYAELHRCDELGACWTVVEALPDDAAWHAIADRLRRAATRQT